MFDVKDNVSWLEDNGEHTGVIKSFYTVRTGNIEDKVAMIAEKGVTGARLVLVTKLKPACSCGEILTYRGDFAAPGYGQSWKCQTCDKPYIKIRGHFVATSDMEPEECIMNPGDVI